MLQGDPAAAGRADRAHHAGEGGVQCLRSSWWPSTVKESCAKSPCRCWARPRSSARATASSCAVSSSVTTCASQAGELAGYCDRVVAYSDPRLAHFSAREHADVLAGLFGERTPLLTLMGHTPWSLRPGSGPGREDRFSARHRLRRPAARRGAAEGRPPGLQRQAVLPGGHEAGGRLPGDRARGLVCRGHALGPAGRDHLGARAARPVAAARPGVRRLRGRRHRRGRHLPGRPARLGRPGHRRRGEHRAGPPTGRAHGRRALLLAPGRRQEVAAQVPPGGHVGQDGAGRRSTWPWASAAPSSTWPA